MREDSWQRIHKYIAREDFNTERLIKWYIFEYNTEIGHGEYERYDNVEYENKQDCENAIAALTEDNSINYYEKLSLDKDDSKGC